MLKHGYNRRSGRTYEYRIWLGMISRCHNPNSRGYRHYGAKGISVCHRWRSSFVDFLDDMGKAPSEKYSINRSPLISGNYEPGNCRWATDLEQNRNSARCRMLTHAGETMCITAWAERIGISSKTLRDRVGKLRWSVEKSLATPVRKS